MLAILRKKYISKVIFWFLVILVMPAFVMWGTGNISGPKDKRPKSVGTINNKNISFDSFAGAVTSSRCQIMINLFDKQQVVNDLLKNKEFIGRMAWDRLIMLKEADKYNIKVPNEELIVAIRSHPMFSRGGAFDNRAYDYILSYSLGMDPRTFEEMVRENIKIQKLNDIIAKDVEATEEEARGEYQKDNAKFKAAYVLVDSAEFVPGISIASDAAKEYYENNKDEFILPAKAGEEKKEVAFAKFEDVEAGIKTRLAEKEAKVKALEKAEDLYIKLTRMMADDKISFADAVSKAGLKISETPAVAKADYVEGLGEATKLVEGIASLKADEISKPIEMRKGVVIAKVTETQSIDEEKYKKDKDQYMKRALFIKRNKILEDWLRRLETQAKLNIDITDYEKYYR